MTPPEELEAEALKLGFRVTLDQQQRGIMTGWHWIDLEINGERVCVIWRESLGFGVSLPSCMEVDGADWKRAAGPLQALCLALALLLKSQGGVVC